MICPKHNFIHPPPDKCPAAVLAKAVVRKARRAQSAALNANLKALASNGKAPPVDFQASNGRSDGKGGAKRAKIGKPKRKKSPSPSKLKKELWTLISLVVRSWSAVCIACKVNPTYSANHIVPANDGAATRFFLPNLYPGCQSCNEAERRQRGSWVYRHKEIFGSDFVDALYAFSETTHQIKKWWVLEQTERMRKLLEVA